VGREKRIGIDYCSKICCMNAVKQAIITKEHDSGVQPYIFYTHLKTYGKGFFEFYRRSKELGIEYRMGRISDVFENKDKSLTLRYEDLEEGKVDEIEVDMLVLSTALVPSKGNEKLSRALKVELDEYGFFKEKDAVNSPLESTSEGIFVCGGATGPVDISETVTKAVAASLKAVSTNGTNNSDKKDEKVTG
jgi:heterodisulfide reductase subunit A